MVCFSNLADSAGSDIPIFTSLDPQCGCLWFPWTQSTPILLTNRIRVCTSQLCLAFAFWKLSKIFAWIGWRITQESVALLLSARNKLVCQGNPSGKLCPASSGQALLYQYFLLFFLAFSKMLRPTCCCQLRGMARLSL